MECSVVIVLCLLPKPCHLYRDCYMFWFACFTFEEHYFVQTYMWYPHVDKMISWSQWNMNNSFSVMSWNVWGLNSPVKRTKFLEVLKRKEVSIALIQEMHLKTTDIHRFQNRFYMYVAHSLGNNGTGRLTYVCLTFNNTNICLASIYGPNTHDPNFNKHNF